MRIALRSGGGRGAYELAGTQGNYQTSDLFDKRILYELTPDLIIPSYRIPSRSNGKPRIKLLKDTENAKNPSHLVLSSILLLPNSRRDKKETPEGELIISHQSYVMSIVKIDISQLGGDSSIVRPTEILLENREAKKKVNFINRMARVMEVWRLSDSDDFGNSRLCALLRKHKESVQARVVDHAEIQGAAAEVFRYFWPDNGNPTCDPLRLVEREMGVEQFVESEEDITTREAEDFGIKDITPSIIARIENVKQWKKIAVRGSAAAQFRTLVKEAYQDTCLFTGQKLPKLDSITSAGVDAAHILPWASYGINNIDNGICLSKQCHWAFDSGLLKLLFDSSTSQYVINIPPRVVLEARKCDFSLDPYLAIEGAIPRDRLPENVNFWPNPKYLDSFNKTMFS